MYVDSGSGSMIISAVVAGAAGAGVVAKMQWRRLSGAMKGKKGIAQGDPTTAGTVSDKTEQQ